MIKRVSWFVSGAVAGIAGAGYAKRKVRETASTLAPVNVAKAAVTKVRTRGHDVIEAVRDGREAMHAKEQELRARLHGEVISLADEVGGHDQVLVDGRPVEAGQVIVLRQMHDNAQIGPRRSSRRHRRSA